MTAEDDTRDRGSEAAHLSPELVPFLLSSIQSQLTVSLLLLFFSLVLGLFVSCRIRYLEGVFLHERCGEISATSPMPTTSPSVSAALPSFAVQATCRGPVLILRSASSTSHRSRTPCVCTEASAYASREGRTGLGHYSLLMWGRTRVVGGIGPGALGGKGIRRLMSGFGRCVLTLPIGQKYQTDHKPHLVLNGDGGAERQEKADSDNHHWHGRCG